MYLKVDFLQEKLITENTLKVLDSSDTSHKSNTDGFI